MLLDECFLTLRSAECLEDSLVFGWGELEVLVVVGFLVGGFPGLVESVEEGEVSLVGLLDGLFYLVVSGD